MFSAESRLIDHIQPVRAVVKFVTVWRWSIMLGMKWSSTSVYESIQIETLYQITSF